MGGIVMWRAINFCCQCVKDAAGGTLERANAWFWFIGVPFVAFVGWYFGLGALTIPDTFQDFMVFMVVTVAASWAIFFVVRLVGAPARLYARLEDDKRESEARIRALEQQRATLTISGPHLQSDARFKNTIHWRMTIHNAGPAPARNVQMKLRNGAPEPKDTHWAGE